MKRLLLYAAVAASMISQGVSAEGYSIGASDDLMQDLASEMEKPLYSPSNAKYLGMLLSILDRKYFDGIADFRVNVDKEKVDNGFQVNINAHMVDEKDFYKLVSNPITIKVKPTKHRPLVTETDQRIWFEILQEAEHQLFADSAESELIATSNDKAYFCKKERSTLCDFGNLITRITGIRMMSTPRINNKDHDLKELQEMIGKANQDNPVVLWSRNLWSDEISIEPVTGLDPADHSKYCYLVAGKDGKKGEKRCEKVDRLLVKRDVGVGKSWADVHFLIRHE